MSKLARISVSSSATVSQKKDLKDKIAEMRKKGFMVVSDWQWDGEDQAYLIQVGSADRKKIAALKVILALSRSLAGAGYR